VLFLQNKTKEHQEQQESQITKITNKQQNQIIKTQTKNKTIKT